MAVEDGSGGKQMQAIRFPCLAILRYTVATVVTVLAVVVIVMVIAVGVRPDNVSVSVVQGHVSTSDLWNETTTYVDAEPATARTMSGRRGGRGGCIGGLRGAPYSELRSCFGPGGGEDGIVGGGGVYSRRPPTRTVYTAVEALSLEVILSVDNPSGRGSIYCQSINVTFRAGTPPTGMEIGAFNLSRSFDFHVKPQTSHKIARSLVVDNPTVLDYIASTYGGESSFTGTVEVTMNTSSVVTQLGHRTPFSIVKLVCSPVDFSVGDATATATAVQCI